MQKQHESIEKYFSEEPEHRSRRPAGAACEFSRPVTMPVARSLVVLVFAAFACAASAQAQAPAASPAPPGARAAAGFGVLLGRWVRPDGGYVITIRGVDAEGKLDAAYANPNPLPFARAEAARDGRTLKLFFELTAGGYGGSTYTLTYDPVNDVLKGVYFQAVAQQTFDVYFIRSKQ
jgi:hypothetical protein